MTYVIIDAQVMVRLSGRSHADAQAYIADALSYKRDVVLLMGVGARDLTPEEHAHLRQEVPDEF